MTQAEFKAVEDAAVRAAIELQEKAGIDVVTDGELRRYAFYGHLIEAFEGFDREGGWAIPFRDEKGEQLILKRPVVVNKLRWKRSMCSEEWTFLRSTARRPGKVTMLSAQQAAAYYDPEKSRGAYPTRDDYLADIVDLSRREVDELVRLGCTYIQIDAPHSDSTSAVATTRASSTPKGTTSRSRAFSRRRSSTGSCSSTTTSAREASSPSCIYLKTGSPSSAW